MTTLAASDVQREQDRILALIDARIASMTTHRDKGRHLMKVHDPGTGDYESGRYTRLQANAALRVLTSLRNEITGSRS